MRTLLCTIATILTAYWGSAQTFKPNPVLIEPMPHIIDQKKPRFEAFPPSHTTNSASGVFIFNNGEEHVVRLPSDFNLTGQYHYELTPIGEFAHLYVVQEVGLCKDNENYFWCFTVFGGFKDLKVSWGVEAITRDYRNDAFIWKNGVPTNKAKR